jgi:hypothetical protein
MFSKIGSTCDRKVGFKSSIWTSFQNFPLFIYLWLSLIRNNVPDLIRWYLVWISAEAVSVWASNTKFNDISGITFMNWKTWWSFKGSDRCYECLTTGSLYWLSQYGVPMLPSWSCCSVISSNKEQNIKLLGEYDHWHSGQTN